jgi:hypothetical protein
MSDKRLIGSKAVLDIMVHLNSYMHSETWLSLGKSPHTEEILGTHGGLQHKSAQVPSIVELINRSEGKRS